MRVQIPLKPRIILALLLFVVIVDAFSMFFLNDINIIVHGDLYKYGLQFNYAWAEQYWTYSYLFLVSLTIAIILTGISIASFSIYVKKHDVISIISCYVLLILGTALMFFSIYLFYSIDHLVHYELYLYGLQFSHDWSSKYLTYARLILALIGFGIATTIPSIALIFLGARKLVNINPGKLVSSTLITTGAITLAFSTIYTSSILAFIGLGLLFWGAILTYIRTEEYVKKILLDTTTSSQQATLNHIIQELQYKGDVIYLPPKYFRIPETYKAYIPEQKNMRLPTPEQLKNHEKDFLIEEPPSVLFTPPGAELAKLFEKTLEINFARVDMQYLKQEMPKLFIENLEIAEDFQMETDSNSIRIQLNNSAYKALNIETQQPATIYSTLGSPLSSAIACVIAKTTGKPIVIEKEQNSKDGRDLTIEYRIPDKEA